MRTARSGSPKSSWLELFGVDVRMLSEHLRNIFRSQELNENSVVRKFRITAADGKSYSTQHYNLDAIIQNDSAILEMGDDTLKMIARELVDTIRFAATVFPIRPHAVCWPHAP